MNRSAIQTLALLVGVAGLASVYMIATSLGTPTGTLTSIAPHSQLAQVADVTSGLVGWWKFDEGNGTVAADSSGNGNAGSISNNPTWLTSGAAVGTGAISFNGTQAVKVTDSSSLDSAQAITISFWVKPTTTTVQRILDKTGDWIIRLNSPTIQFIKGTFFSSRSAITPNVWTHVALVADGTNYYFYLNGVLDSQTAYAWTAGTGDIIMAGSMDPYSGGLDDVRIYNRALSSSEIANVYASASGTSGTGSAGGTTNPPPTTTAPVISGVSVSAISSTAATISWTTDQPSDGQVVYGTTASYGSNSGLNNSLVTSHMATISPLLPNTGYHYAVISKNSAEQSTQSPDGSLTTQAATVSNQTSCPNTAGSCWFVDNSLPSSGTHDGKSWATAWNDPTQATGISAGDYVYISGGPVGSSQTYHTQSWTPFGGTASSYVTYRTGQDSLHGGSVIFDGVGAANFMNIAYGCNKYFTIDGIYNGNRSMTVKNYTTGIYGDLCSNVTIRDMTFYSPIRFNGAGNTVEISGNLLVTNNTDHAIQLGNTTGLIHDNVIQVSRDGASGNGDDAIQSPGAGSRIYNNKIVGYVIPSYTAGQHQDGVQGWANDIRIYNNIFANLGNSCVFITPYNSIVTDLSNIWIYNNVCENSPETFSVSNNDTGQTSNIHGLIIANNVISDGTVFNYLANNGGSYNNFFSDDIISNNVIYNLKAPYNIDGNITAQSNSVITDAAGADGYFTSYVVPVSFASFNASSYDFHLTSLASPYIKQGTNLISYFTTDKDGIQRPTAGVWDIGPYVYAGSVTTSPPSTQPGTYYIDFASGSDANVGTSPAAAWQHVPGDSAATSVAAAHQILAGDTFIFKGGVSYEDAFTVQGNGTVSNPVVYDGNSSGTYGSGRAIIDGSDLIPSSQWVPCSVATCGGNANYAHMYYTHIQLPSYLLHLYNSDNSVYPAINLNMYQGAEPLNSAQYPKSSSLLVQTRSSYLLPDSVTNTSLTDSRLSSLGGSSLIGSYVYLWVSPNEIVARQILSYDATTNTITFNTASVYPRGTFETYPDGTVYAIANSFGTSIFNAPGEYYLNPTPNADGTYSLYVWPWNEENLTQSSDVALSGTRLMVAGSIPTGNAVRIGDGSSNIAIRGFKFQKFGGGSALVKYYAGDPSQAATNITISNNEITMMFGPGDDDAMALSNMNSVVIKNNLIHDTRGKDRGMTVSGSNVIIQGNTLTNIARTGIYTSASNSAIIDNLIQGGDGAHGNGISTYGASSASYSNVLVAGNKIDYGDNYAYTLSSISNATVINNLFSGASGVACWGDCVGVKFINNTIKGMASLSNVTNPLIKNNILIGQNIVNSDATDVVTDGDVATCDVSGCTMSALDRSSIFVQSPRYVGTVGGTKYMPSTQNQSYLYVDRPAYSAIHSGDIMRISGDSTFRYVASSTYGYFAGDWRTQVSFSPSANLTEGESVEFWPAGTSVFSSDYHLAQASVAIGKGYNPSADLTQAAQSFPYYNFYSDIDGNARPISGAWDIGAYKYTGVISNPPPPTTDTTPPVVSITAPANASTVSGASVPISVTATDNVAISTVQLKVDGIDLPNGLLTTPTSGSTYSGTWDTTSVSNISHVITAIATDSSGNTTTSQPITVTVSNVQPTSSPTPTPTATPINPTPVATTTTTTPTTPTTPSGGGGGTSTPPPVITSGGGGGAGIGTFTPSVPQKPVTKPCTTLPSAIPASALLLTIGTRGVAVTNLQTFLVLQGYLAKQYITGYYGNLTKAALASYQAAHPTSTCNNQDTRNNNQTNSNTQIPSFTRSLTIGATGTDVKYLQIFLNGHGFTVASVGNGSKGHETTYFGPATTKAVAAFQRAYNITPAYGYFGPVTRGKVNQLLRM